MIELVTASALERSIKSIFIIVLILLFRRKLNIRSIKWANIILWSILFVYLLFPYSFFIQCDGTNHNGIVNFILKPIIIFNEYIRMFSIEFGYILSKINQTLIASLFLIYVVIQIIKRNKAMKEAVLIDKDNRMETYIDLFGLKRNVDIFINDEIKVPITYGIIRPKIVLQSRILEDDDLLKYVLIHEMTHIKKFDIVFKHIKNLVSCLYWHNIFILLASRYMEDDIEILCDKLVIQKVGDTVQNRKEYCLSMLKLIEQNETKRRVVLKLHPTKERMVIMKKWRRGISGVCALILVMILSTTAFADVKVIDNERVISSEISETAETIENNMVKEVSDEEYNSLTLGEIYLEEDRIANVNDKVTLAGIGLLLKKMVM